LLGKISFKKARFAEAAEGGQATFSAAKGLKTYFTLTSLGKETFPNQHSS
jgi:hypothetical protein